MSSPNQFISSLGLTAVAQPGLDSVGFGSTVQITFDKLPQSSVDFKAISVSDIYLTLVSDASLMTLHDGLL